MISVSGTIIDWQKPTIRVWLLLIQGTGFNLRMQSPRSNVFPYFYSVQFPYKFLFAFNPTNFYLSHIKTKYISR